MVTVVVRLVVNEVVTDVVPVVDTVVVTLVVGVVESHRRNDSAQSKVPDKNPAHCLASLIHGPAVSGAQPEHSANSSGSRQRR